MERKLKNQKILESKITDDKNHQKNNQQNQKENFKFKLLTKMQIFLTVLLVIILGISSLPVSYAKDLSESPKMELATISEEYKNWEKLPQEERAKISMPPVTNIEYKDAIKRSTYNASIQNVMAKAENLESKYNTMDSIQAAGIKAGDQKRTGICYAFSFSRMLEINTYKAKKLRLSLSPTHAEYKITQMFNRKLGDGGSLEKVYAYATSANGPVKESLMKFDDYYTGDNSSDPGHLKPINTVTVPNATPELQIKNSKIFPMVYKMYNSDGTVEYKNSTGFLKYKKYTEDEVIANRNEIKKAIKQYGAVRIGIRGNSMADYMDYYNPTTAAYFYDGSLPMDHSVVVVGWDDNYSKNNFNSKKIPTHDGAYICLNSWGTNWGKNGYFYTSYDDTWCEAFVDVATDLSEKLNYDNLYQYDELGQNQGITINKGGSLYGANKFKSRKKDGKDEYLTSVGLYIKNTSGIKIFLAKTDDLNNRTLIAAPGPLEYGYHVVELSSPIKIDSDQFSVIVEYTNNEMPYVPIECNLDESGLTGNYSTPTPYSKATGNAGESFTSLDGSTWEDLEGLKLGDATLHKTNANIKAFTKYNDAPKDINVTGVTLDKKDLTLDVGKTANLVATVTPQNATNKNVKWSSSDSSIATVNNGVITAVKQGTATITVTTEDGGKTAKCNVTVSESKTDPNPNPGDTKISVTGVSLNTTSINLEVDKTETLVATVTPQNATNKNVKWSSTNENVVTVNNQGVVTAKGKGTAEIIVTTEDGGKTAKCEVTVTEPQKNPDPNPTVVNVKSISLDKTEASLQVSDTMNLKVTINPTNATNKKIIWKSSNTSVATVNENGVITALKEGKATISATSEDGGKTAVCLLTVTKKTNTDDDIYKDNTNKNNTNSNNGNTSNNYNSKGDTTVANKNLPKTGLRITAIIIIVAIIGISIFKFIQIKRLKDVD